MKLFIGVVCILFYLVQCEATNGIVTNGLNITITVPESNLVNLKVLGFDVMFNQKDKRGKTHEYIFFIK